MDAGMILILAVCIISVIMIIVVCISNSKKVDIYMKKVALIIVMISMMISSAACKNNENSNKTNVEGNASDKIATNNDSSEQNSKLDFSTTDIDGKSVSNKDIKNSKVVMVNFWEPWCGPCVKEMPELEKLYKKYKDKGFTMLRVFYSMDSIEDAKGIIKDNNISYPILVGNKDFKKFTTEYVPTTFFFDAEGKQLNSEAVVGAKEYDEWEKEILKYLNE